MSRNTFGWVALGGVVFAAIAWIVRELTAVENTLSAQGWIALTLGMLGTAAVAGVLMWLLFQIDRRGYDR